MLGGTDWDPEIERNLRACHVFVLLVSAHSMASTTSSYIIDKEITIIRERQAKGERSISIRSSLPQPGRLGSTRSETRTCAREDGKPLSGYLPAYDRAQHMSEIANEIASVVGSVGPTLAPHRRKAPSLLALKSLRSQTSRSGCRPLHGARRCAGGDRDGAQALRGSGRDHGPARIARHWQDHAGGRFAERHREDYRATWWIRAQTEPTARPRQIDLFAEDTGKTAPTWRELPEEARVRLTDLMARLILDHARLDGAIPSKEVGDDL